MSPRRPAAHSTGPSRTPYFEDDPLVHVHPSSDSTSIESLSSGESGSWQSLGDDDIQPSESASRPPRNTSSERHSSRHSSRPQHNHSHSHESRPTSSRRKSSARVPTIREEERQQAHRSHSDHHSARDRDERYQYREEREREYSRHPREHRSRELSSGSSSTDSYDSYMSGGSGYAEAPHHSHAHPAPYQHMYQHAPQPPQSNYPPTVMSGHTAYNPYGHPMQPQYDSLIHVPRPDPLDPMGQYPGYSASNPFSPLPLSANPLSPGASAAGGYFDPHYDHRPASQPPQQQHHYHPQRPQPPRSRPQSYVAPSPYPMETAMAPYYAVPRHGYAGMPAFPPGTDPALIVEYMVEMRLRAEQSSSSSREDLRSRKSKSKSPAAEPAPVAPPVVAPVPPVVAVPPPVVEAPKPEPPVDHAAKLVTLLAEYEAKKQADADQKAAAVAAAAAVEQAKKDAANMESAKIEKMLAAWRKEQEKREKDKQDAAEAARAAAEAKAAEEAKFSAAIAAAKEAAEQAADAKAKAAEAEATAKAKAAEAEATAKAQAAEAEATAKAKAAEEEYTKKMAEATAAAEEAAKAKKALEDENAKLQPEADATKKPISFSDAMGRTFDVPWQFAKTWKGMRSLINDAFDPVGGELSRDVLDGRYDMIGPDEKIIIPKLWDLVIQPGWEVKMSLWPPSKDAVEVVMMDTPGAFMDYAQVVDVGVKKSSKKKADKAKSSEPKKNRHVVDVPPPLPPMGLMAPPHHAGTYVPDEPVAPKKPKPKPKPKQSSKFAGWITGTSRPAKSGKEPEKLSSGPLVHHISNTESGSNDSNNSNNSQGNDERDYYIIKRSVSSGAARGATTAHATAALPSARQSKAGGYHDADRPIEVGCSMM